MTQQEPTPELAAAIERGFAARDRDDMGPTIAYFEELLTRHPGNAHVLYEVGGSYDTAGREDEAVAYYEQALAAGLSGDTLRKCLLHRHPLRRRPHTCRPSPHRLPWLRRRPLIRRPMSHRWSRWSPRALSGSSAPAFLRRAEAPWPSCRCSRTNG